MTTINEKEMSKSLCNTCKNYIYVPDDTFGSWCSFFKDIFSAIREGKIVIESNGEPIDRSTHYDQSGLVYCEGYQPK